LRGPRNFALLLLLLLLLLSSTMAITNSRDNEDNSYYHVRDLAVKLLLNPTLHLNNDDLTTAGIEVAAMDITTGTPADSSPQFCDLYPRGEFDTTFKMVDEWPQRKGPGGYHAALQMRRLFESSFLDGGLTSHSKYVWRR
jgi:hypothetical protein